MMRPQFNFSTNLTDIFHLSFDCVKIVSKLIIILQKISLNMTVCKQLPSILKSQWSLKFHFVFTLEMTQRASMIVLP